MIDDSSVAAAQLLPAGSDTGDDVSIYQLKWVEWGEEFAPVVVQVGGWSGGGVCSCCSTGRWVEWGEEFAPVVVQVGGWSGGRSLLLL